jgi:hypothetical protein
MRIGYASSKLVMWSLATALLCFAALGQTTQARAAAGIDRFAVTASPRMHATQVRQGGVVGRGVVHGFLRAAPRGVKRSNYRGSATLLPYGSFLGDAFAASVDDTPIVPEVIVVPGPPQIVAPATHDGPADYTIGGCRPIPNGYHCDVAQNQSSR